MRTKEKILKLLADKESCTATTLAERLAISRQAVSKHLRDLVASGRVRKEGVTRGACFRLAKLGERPQQERWFDKKLPLPGLEEDLVFEEISVHLALRDKLSSECFAIVNYAFTEILNNAIEHSLSGDCHLRFGRDKHDVRFVIRDRGIGAFHSIQSRFGLVDEDAAVAELLKGKATTMAERHSGEGIFFTSKCADRFVLRSHRTALTCGPGKEDVRIEETRFLKGTEVRFLISARSRRKLGDIFREYAPEEFDYKFDKTHVLVRLSGGECVSRSIAKRMVARLSDFKEVVLDFKDVSALGQAFADEVFRVFMRAHPGLIVRLKNLSPTLKPMVEHAVGARIAQRITFAD